MRHVARNSSFLSDCDILALQNIFLTSGYHTMYTSDICRSRELIGSLISVFPMFSSVAFLALDSSALPTLATPLYFELFSCTDFSSSSIDDYLLNAFYYDFLWIECSSDLLEASWFNHFRQRLYDFNILKSLSVLALDIS